MEVIANDSMREVLAFPSVSAFCLGALPQGVGEEVCPAGEVTLLRYPVIFILNELQLYEVLFFLIN